jgi:hypothetical protein
MSDSESDHSERVFLELDKDYYEEDVHRSTSLKRVLRLIKLDTHETLGISDIAGMVRGTPEEVVPKIKDVFLGLVDPTTNQVGILGRAAPNAKESDPRIFSIAEWTSKCPLPLGGITYGQLRLIFHLHTPLEDTETLKLAADIVPVPPLYTENSPKMKRVMTWKSGETKLTSTLRLRGGSILCIENAFDAMKSLDVQIGTITLTQDPGPHPGLQIPLFPTSVEARAIPQARTCPSVWDIIQLHTR